jgi:hypothetical protein
MRLGGFPKKQHAADKEQKISQQAEQNELPFISVEKLFSMFMLTQWVLFGLNQRLGVHMVQATPR